MSDDDVGGRGVDRDADRTNMVESDPDEAVVDRGRGAADEEWESLELLLAKRDVGAVTEVVAGIAVRREIERLVSVHGLPRFAGGVEQRSGTDGNGQSTTSSAGSRSSFPHMQIPGFYPSRPQSRELMDFDHLVPIITATAKDHRGPRASTDSPAAASPAAASTES